MKKMNKNRIGKLLLVAFATVMFLTACEGEAQRVSQNVSREADNFNVVRRVTVINMRTDEIAFEVIGTLSIETKAGRLDIIADTEDGYKKHMINMTDWNMYVVEDLEGSDVSNIKYEVNYRPEMIQPFDIITDFD